MSNFLDRWFAGIYDGCMSSAEAGGLTAWRASLLGGLEGRVLEIGAGTGLNLAHYPESVELVLLEPDAAMRSQLAARAHDQPIYDGVAEALPFEDASFDAVVCGLVLCSVTDVAQSLAEIRRVLRPGGRFVFIEHVASEAGWVRVLQHLANPVWKIAGRGCHLTRDTGRALEDAGFEVDLQRAPMPGGGLLPTIRGVARLDRADR